MTTVDVVLFKPRKSRLVRISAYPKHAILQWRIVNHEEAKKFLGEAYIGVYSKRAIRDKRAAHLGFRSSLGEAQAAPGDYIIRTESGRFVPVDREIYERLI